MIPLDENLPEQTSRFLEHELEETLSFARECVLNFDNRLEEIGWDKGIQEHQDVCTKIGARLFWIGHNFVKASHREKRLMDRLDFGLPKLKS